MRYTEAQARQITLEARANVAGARASILQWRDGDTRRREGATRFVTKTIAAARADTPVQEMDSNTVAWAAWVNTQIDEKLSVVVEALEVFSEACVSALDRHDAKIRALRDELDIRINLGRKVARLKDEIVKARAMQPNFEAELASLRETVEKQAKTITRLRGEASQLRYMAEQSGKEISLTAIRVSGIGEATRSALRQLHDLVTPDELAEMECNGSIS